VHLFFGRKYINKFKSPFDGKKQVGAFHMAQMYEACYFFALRLLLPEHLHLDVKIS